MANILTKLAFDRPVFGRILIGLWAKYFRGSHYDYLRFTRQLRRPGRWLSPCAYAEPCGACGGSWCRAACACPQPSYTANSDTCGTSSPDCNGRAKVCAHPASVNLYRNESISSWTYIDYFVHPIIGE